jgi:hypothetical protein
LTNRLGGHASISGVGGFSDKDQMRPPGAQRRRESCLVQTVRLRRHRLFHGILCGGQRGAGLLPHKGGQQAVQEQRTARALLDQPQTCRPRQRVGTALAGRRVLRFQF